MAPAWQPGLPVLISGGLISKLIKHTQGARMLDPCAFVLGVGMCLLVSSASAGPVQDGQIDVHAAPERPFVEVRLHTRLVNFDILLHNASSTSYRLVALRLKVFDSKGELQVSRQLNENGKPPAIELMGKLRLGPGETTVYFQPFTEFDDIVRLHRMQVELLFVRAGEHAAPIAQRSDLRLAFDVFPRSYQPSPYLLPLRGSILVQDGHDFYSHHRRHGLAPAAAITRPAPNMYAYDFVKVSRDGETVRGDPGEKANWLSYGAPVRAPADGVVVRAVGNVAENTFDRKGESVLPPSAAESDPDGFGNYVVIRHGDGRCSWLLHLQPGSLSVHPGQQVRAGQYLGKIGFSGDSLFPHLHYTVTDGAGYPSAGMPSYFKRFIRIAGSSHRIEQNGQLDTGDIIEALPEGASSTTRDRAIRPVP